MVKTLYLRRHRLGRISLGGASSRSDKSNYSDDEIDGGGSFPRIKVYINLDRLFVSQVLVNGEIQRVEYDSLPIIYFSCCKYGNNKDMCPMVVVDRNIKEGVERMTIVTRETNKEDDGALGTAYGP
ncbi:hypothetical protein PVK06_024786 [Gossypium arboreum]|uniref:Uncharacterized protein n=1 Tax=Gossypium arboreum TaxID=29729 RepID=A0ABR0PEW0_GOSAR|nr:hypothetical protein PVK06_024786 [Gossypium arboreum]